MLQHNPTKEGKKNGKEKGGGGGGGGGGGERNPSAPTLSMKPWEWLIISIEKPLPCKSNFGQSSAQFFFSSYELQMLRKKKKAIKSVYFVWKHTNNGFLLKLENSQPSQASVVCKFQFLWALFIKLSGALLSTFN